jgi:hypothetical protein
MRFFLSTTLLIAVAAGLAVSAAARTDPSHPGRLELLASVKKTVTVNGVPITGLYPGASQTLTVTVKNGNHFKIKLATVKTAVAAKTSLTGCTGSTTNLVVTPPKSTLKIAPMKTGKLLFTVTMPRSVANACQGARFTISITVKAVKG